MLGLQIANLVLTILGVVLLMFSFMRDDNRWVWFALTAIALIGAGLTEYLRRRACKAAQQRSIARGANG